MNNEHWLCSFEDGMIKQMKADPSGLPALEDQESIDADILLILKYEDGKFLDFVPEKQLWIEVETIERNKNDN